MRREGDVRSRLGLQAIQIRAGRFKSRYSGPKSPGQALPILDGKDTGAKLYRSRPPQACSVRLTVTMAMPRASPIWAWLRGAAQEFPSVMPLALAL